MTSEITLDVNITSINCVVAVSRIEVESVDVCIAIFVVSERLNRIENGVGVAVIIRFLLDVVCSSATVALSSSTVDV